MLILLFAGLVLIGVGSIFAIRNPRVKGEPLASRRLLYIGVTFLGAIAVLSYGIWVVMTGKGA